MSSAPSLGSQLDSARAKLHRAHKQIQALKQSMRRFGNGDRYGNGAKAYDPGLSYIPSREVHVPARRRRTDLGVEYIEPAHTRTLFRRIDIVATLTPKADFSAQYVRWGLLVGEIVHNISSALDNLVWELAQPISPPPPRANSKDRSLHERRLIQVGFPYTKERKDWAGHCRDKLHFVPDPTTRTIFEQAQAFYAWESFGTDPDTFALYVLRELWNRDKHKAINVTTTGLEFQVPRVRIPSLFPSSDYLPSKVIQQFPMRPIVGETEMAVIQVDLPKEIEFPTGRELELTVNVNPQYTLAILFGDGSPGEGLNAIDILQRAHQLATQIVDEFR